MIQFSMSRSALVLMLSLGVSQIFEESARAAVFSSTFNVTASVTNACTVSGTHLNFGTYSSISGTPVLGTSTITVLCTIGGNYSVRLNSGITGSNVTNRKMSDGASHTLNYDLYRDASRTLNWGETDGTDTVEGVGTGFTQNYTVYGRIPASQNVPVGAYSDTVTVTVLF